LTLTGCNAFAAETRHAVCQAMPEGCLKERAAEAIHRYSR
jgi:hypothetical protein